MYSFSLAKFRERHTVKKINCRLASQEFRQRANKRKRLFSLANLKVGAYRLTQVVLHLSGSSAVNRNTSQIWYTSYTRHAPTTFILCRPKNTIELTGKRSLASSSCRVVRKESAEPNSKSDSLVGVEWSNVQESHNPLLLLEGVFIGKIPLRNALLLVGRNEALICLDNNDCTDLMFEVDKLASRE